jgi:ubiquinone/menaquinone biosynthesis C-methylase UbiE
MTLDEDRVQKIAQWYDTIASSYDELYGEEQALKHQTILEQIRSKKRMTILLDVGCGTGRFLENADPFYSLGIGVDVAKRMLLIAKQRASSKNDFVQATSTNLPIKNNIVDCTVSVSTSEAGVTVSGFIREVERIGNENSMLAMILFEQPVNNGAVPMAGVMLSRKINDREALYVLELNPTGSRP